jgi:hypothetical protein
MPPVAILMMAAFAVYVAKTLVRALRSGIIFSDGVGYDAHAQPAKFASTVVLHGGGVLLFAGLAFSATIAKLWPFIGHH